MTSTTLSPGSADAARPSPEDERELESLIPCQEALAKNVARVMGDQSAAAKALTELENRRRQGQAAIVYLLRGTWLVGSRVEIASALVDANAKRYRAGRAGRRKPC